MKKIVIFLFVVMVINIFGDDNSIEFSKEEANTAFKEKRIYEFSPCNFKFDLDGDGKDETIEYKNTRANCITINKKEFYLKRKRTYAQWDLIKKNNKVYIGFNYRRHNAYIIDGYEYNGKELVSIKRKNSELKNEIEEKIAVINGKIKKSKRYDLYEEGKMKREECEEDYYDIDYDSNNNIIKVTNSELSQTGESGSIETQYFENGKMVCFVISEFTMYDGEEIVSGYVNNGKVEKYVYDSENELANELDDGTYFKDKKVPQSFLVNNKFKVRKREWE